MNIFMKLYIEIALLFLKVATFLKSKIKIILTMVEIIAFFMLYNIFSFTPLLAFSGLITLLFLSLSIIWGKIINIKHENLEKDVFVFATGWLTPASISGMFFIAVLYLAWLQEIWI